MGDNCDVRGYRSSRILANSYGVGVPLVLGLNDRRRVVGSGRKDTSVTEADVYKASEAFLDALDAAPIGSGTVLKDKTSKDWMETSVLRAFGKLGAAAYHGSNVWRLVQGMSTMATESAARIEKEHLGETATVRIGGRFPTLEVAYEVDAFLTAARACIDFGGSVLALHLGMNRRTSIAELLKSQAKKTKPPFAFLLAWAPWIEDLKKYRDECVHYRTLRAYSGYEAVRKKGSVAFATIPFVVPRQVRPDEPDTRELRMFEMDNDPDGLDKIEDWTDLTRGDGSVEVLGHSIRYEPSDGYMRVEEFCSRHLDKLREFLVRVFEEALAADFKFQHGAPH